MALVVGVIAALLSMACGGDEGSSSGSEREIRVFAAASLTDSFQEVGAAFEEANPGIRVTFNFAASSALATQINEGAPADVFASADQSQMEAVTDKGNADSAVVFARNTPVVVVPRGDSPVAEFRDLAKPGVKLVLAAPDVPIGRYSREILRNASEADGVAPDFSDRVLSNLKSNETNVRAVLTKVQLGEADAGIVYRTDVRAAGDEVRVIEIPEAYNVVAECPVAVTRQARGAETAKAFIDFLLSPAGAAILEKHGFLRP